MVNLKKKRNILKRRMYKGYGVYAMQTGRSKKAYIDDKSKRGKYPWSSPKTKSGYLVWDKWIKNPDKYDWPGIDTPPINKQMYFAYLQRGPRVYKERKKNKFYRRYHYEKGNKKVRY